MKCIKGETIHRMYRFGSWYVEAAYDTNDMMLIFWQKVVLNIRFLLLVII